MNPNNETENIEDLSDRSVIDESAKVDDFIKELEAKEKDLHITADTTFIEIAEDLDDDEFPEYLSVEHPPTGQDNISPVVTLFSEQDRNPNFQLEKEITELKSKVAVLEAERSEMFTNSQRRAKDFESFKSRTARERGETFQNQLSNLAIKMLPALDNLDRAMKFASELPETKRNKLLQYFDGIALVNQQVKEVLADMGILPIDTVGSIFDPHFHEAVAIEESSDLPPNMIFEELIRGYRIGEKVIRHSMVKVSKYLPVNEASKAAVSDDYDDAVIPNGPFPKDESVTPGDTDPASPGETPENE